MSSIADCLSSSKKKIFFSIGFIYFVLLVIWLQSNNLRGLLGKNFSIGQAYFFRNIIKNRLNSSHLVNIYLDSGYSPGVVDKSNNSTNNPYKLLRNGSINNLTYTVRDFTIGNDSETTENSFILETNKSKSIEHLAFESEPTRRPLVREILRHVDIHLHDANFGHAGETTGKHEVVSNDILAKSIAIGGGITSKKITGITTSNLYLKFPIFKNLLPSFCKTVSEGYFYHFYLAYDNTDPFFTKQEMLKAFHKTFRHIIDTACPRNLSVGLHFVQCAHAHKPAWAQNDAMMEAYLDDMEYYYRINDDTNMQTSRWAEAFISALDRYKPTKVGVVGPHHQGGNTGILTYDFVHRTHVDIFGFYYPRVFSDWFGDDWITKVYQPGRSTKLTSIKLKHTMELGQRYSRDKSVGGKLAGEIIKDKVILNRYLRSREEKRETVDGKRIMSMSLYGRDPLYTMGAIRNAQLLPVILPGWQLRIYTARVDTTNVSYANLTVPARVLHKLNRLGAQLAYLDPEQVGLPPTEWRTLIADDENVDYFLIRDADYRVSDRETSAIKLWIETGRAVFCIRDHPSHTMAAVNPGLWGGRPKLIHSILNDTVFSTLQEGIRKYIQSKDDKNIFSKLASSLYQQSFPDMIVNELWPQLSPNALCLDSVSCRKYPGSFPFPAQRVTGDYVGRKYSHLQLPLVKKEDSWLSPSECTNALLKANDITHL